MYFLFNAVFIFAQNNIPSYYIYFLIPYFQPVPPDDLAQARIEFNSFVSGYLKAFDKSVATSKVHELTHVPDDVKKSQVHLEALGAYKYENLQRLWNGVLRSGTNPIAQIRYG